MRKLHEIKILAEDKVVTLSAKLSNEIASANYQVIAEVAYNLQVEKNKVSDAKMLLNVFEDCGGEKAVFDQIFSLFILRSRAVLNITSNEQTNIEVKAKLESISYIANALRKFSGFRL